MKKIAYSPRFLIALLFALFVSSFSAAQTGMEKQQAVDELFAEWNAKDSPGCALSIIQDGEVIYSWGYGMADLEHDVPITPQTVFYIGSVSKQFVAMCMLLLDEQGLIDLDEDVRTYLPELPDYGYKITSRNLIHHTSGIRDNLTLWELAGNSILDEIPEAEIFDMICRQEELNFEPGSQYLYSNSCYFLMSIIVKRASGKSLREYADEHIFKPLGMKNTQFGDDNRRIIKNRAFGYQQTADGEIENMILRFDLVGSGGLYSCVEDLYLWDQNFYQNQLGTRGDALIKDMLTNGRYKDGSEVNYAFAVVNGNYKGLATIQHSGALAGYRSFYVQFPERQFSVVILSNLANFLPGDLAFQVADVYLKKEFNEEEGKRAAVAPEAPKTVKVAREKPTTDILKTYAGTYYSKELDARYTLELEKGELTLKVKNQSPLALKSISKTIFVAGSLTLNFQISEKDAIAGFRLEAGRVRNLKFLRE